MATWRPEALGGKTDFSLLFNQTETDITQFNPDTLGERRIRQIKEALPETRWMLSANHRIGDKWRLLGRLSYFDGWHDVEDGQDYGGEYVVDLEAAYTFRDGLTLVLGAQNVLDTYPDENNIRGDVGNRYSQYSPFGFNGGFWYARLKYNFNTPWGS